MTVCRFAFTGGWATLSCLDGLATRFGGKMSTTASSAINGASIFDKLQFSLQTRGLRIKAKRLSLINLQSILITDPDLFNGSREITVGAESPGEVHSLSARLTHSLPLLCCCSDRPTESLLTSSRSPRTVRGLPALSRNWWVGNLPRLVDLFMCHPSRSLPAFSPR